MAGEIIRLAQWQAARPVINQAIIKTPGTVAVVYQVAGEHNQTGVLERLDHGKKQNFIDFHVESKPFKQVVANLRRSSTLARKRQERAS